MPVPSDRPPVTCQSYLLNMAQSDPRTSNTGSDLPEGVALPPGIVFPPEVTPTTTPAPSSGNVNLPPGVHLPPGVELPPGIVFPPECLPDLQSDSAMEDETDGAPSLDVSSRFEGAFPGISPEGIPGISPESSLQQSPSQIPQRGSAHTLADFTFPSPVASGTRPLLRPNPHHSQTYVTDSTSRASMAGNRTSVNQPHPRLSRMDSGFNDLPRMDLPAFNLSHRLSALYLGGEEADGGPIIPPDLNSSRGSLISRGMSSRKNDLDQFTAQDTHLTPDIRPQPRTRTSADISNQNVVEESKTESKTKRPTKLRDSGFSDSHMPTLSTKSQSELHQHSRAQEGLMRFNFPTPGDHALWYQIDNDGDTPLLLSIIHKLSHISMQMISSAPEVSLLDHKNLLQQTALHLAVLTHQPAVARGLVLAGASLDTRDRHGNTALHLACRLGDLDSIAALTQPINVQAERSSGPLYYTAPQRQIPQDLTTMNYDGETCLHVAVSSGQLCVVEYLLSSAHVQASPNMADGKSGRTILHHAVEARDVPVVLLLLARRDLHIDAPTFDGTTPLALALGRGYMDIANMLVNAGACPDNVPPSDSDSDCDCRNIEMEES